MTIALPTASIAHAEPRFIDRGGVLRATLGGNDQRLDRLGSKWGCTFTTKPMKAAEARIWISRLIRGKAEKASIKFPQPGFVPAWSGDGTTTGATLANASVVHINRQFAGDLGKKLVEGQFITFLVAGQRYLHQVTADATLTDVGGVYKAITSIYPSTRVAIPNASSVEVLAPNLEGYVQGDDLSWSVDNAKIYGFQFDIEEAG